MHAPQNNEPTKISPFDKELMISLMHVEMGHKGSHCQVKLTKIHISH
jgi:hypothetical protein